MLGDDLLRTCVRGLGVAALLSAACGEGERAELRPGDTPATGLVQGQPWEVFDGVASPAEGDELYFELSDDSISSCPVPGRITRGLFVGFDAPAEEGRYERFIDTTRITEDEITGSSRMGEVEIDEVAGDFIYGWVHLDGDEDAVEGDFAARVCP